MIISGITVHRNPKFHGINSHNFYNIFAYFQAIIAK